MSAYHVSYYVLSIYVCLSSPRDLRFQATWDHISYDWRQTRGFIEFCFDIWNKGFQNSSSH